MNKVYTLSPKGQRECLANPPTLPAELTRLLRLVDGRRTRSDVLAATGGKNAITAGGLRWLTASGYIERADTPPPTSAPAPLPCTPPTASAPASQPPRPASTAPRSSRTDAQVCEALAGFMVQSIRRRLGEGGYPHRRQIERATQVVQLLPHLGPLTDAIVQRAGPAAGAEFADTAAFLLHPLG
ncbi:MAG: hypothetical protein Q4G71_08315 [Pseudomonadota bacterium]|nr:hypothetical protein [Pseudomonadota bacterium]